MTLSDAYIDALEEALDYERWEKNFTGKYNLKHAMVETTAS